MPVKISLVNPAGQFVGGKVDLDFVPRAAGTNAVSVRGVDASQDIDVGAPQRLAAGDYQLTVRSTTGAFAPITQPIHVTDAGGTVKIVVDRGAPIVTPVAPVGPAVTPGGPAITPIGPAVTPVGGPAVTPGGPAVTPVGPVGPGGPVVVGPIDVGPVVVVPQSTVSGTLVFDHGLPAAGVTTRAYHIGFGSKATQLGVDVVTNAAGGYLISYAPPVSPINLQMRVVDVARKERTISATKYNAASTETLNLVVPADVKPLAPEFTRLATDVSKAIGSPAGAGADISKLAQAKEDDDHHDLSLLSQSTSWDARLVALAATAVQQSATTGLPQDVLYALYRAGMPSDPTLLAAVPSTTVSAALKKAADAGIVAMTDQQIGAAVTAVQTFASKTLLATTAPGAVSSFHDMLAPILKDTTPQHTAFANLYFSQGSIDGSFWTKAAQLNIPAATIDALKLQGKFLYLTSNNSALAQTLQAKIGSAASLGQLADQDFHKPDTWTTTLKTIAGAGGDAALDKLVPEVYQGKNATERAAAYAGDLARKVRLSFPTQVTARMIESKELKIDAGAAPTVTSFLRKAAPLGYGLGRTPLNRFLKASGNAVPALDATATSELKTLHRLYQITPSPESLQVALDLGFKSAFDIAKYPEDEFLAKFETKFPGLEGKLVYHQSRTVSSVTFNAFAAAKALESSPPIYGSSGSLADQQAAKNTLVQMFPSMQSLFGNLDFCDCDECRSVLSPAAYFVDVLDLLGQHSAPNAAGFTPLDVLIGKNATVPGRRPDLGALPLTCENTNTALPYIDVVNEILEYYIAHAALDAGVAYDTGGAETADLVAEPQHIQPNVYTTTLKNARYPMTLPFDLWIETVRGFLSYFDIPLATLLDAFRQANTIELFARPPVTPYFRAQILAESLGISPAEYAVFTASNGANWRTLYGAYANDAAAIADLKSAKTLSTRLGVSYQDVVDLVQTGFLNPALYPLIYQFNRFGLSMADAFSFTNQPGFPALSAAQTTAFGAKLDAITASYLQKNPTSTFNARTWLAATLTPNYSRKVLVLADPDSGCNFATTTLQYADGSAVTALDLLKFNLFVRLWKKLGWTIDEVDRALQLFFPSNLPAFADPGFAAAFGAAWKTALVYLAHLEELNTTLEPALGRTALLPLWSSLPTQGESPLYSQLFLTASVLNNDFALDDPSGAFPWPSADLAAASRPLAAHSAAVQGALGLSASDIDDILADANVAAPATLTLANLSICYRYSLLAQCLELSVSDLIALRVMSGRQPFQVPSGLSITTLAQDVVLNQTLAFVKQVATVQDSAFSVEDLKYLLRHMFDPVGKYQSDPNALMALVQTASGLTQVRTQNAVPPDLMSQAESLIDQKLSGLVPATILKTLVGHVTNAQTYSTSQTGVAVAIDPAPFALEPALVFQYDAVTQTQTVGYQGLLTDWKKAQLETINATPLFAGLLDGVQTRARDALAASINDVLGVWASLVQYEAVALSIAPAAAIADPLKKLAVDPALAFTYDQSDQLQWLGYRGVLTDQKKAALVALNNSATLAGLLTNVQQQSLPAYKELVGSILAMWTGAQTYVATAAAVTPANQVDGVAFAAAVVTAQQNGTIVDPVPALAFAYDATTQIESVTCQGVLTESMRVQLTALTPSAVVAGLLQSIRNACAQQFQTLATNLLTIVATDLDNYSKPFLSIDTAKRQRLVKASLVKVFSPLLARKLSRQFILQTLTATLSSDPSITEALVTDAALLSDPSTPGESLLDAFLAIGSPGVTASYYASANLSGAVLASGTAATVDTSDPTNSVAGMHSCRFEGYLQPATDGPYRFFAWLGNTNAEVTLSVESPDPASLFPAPVLHQIAAANGEEASQFLTLKGGVAYHFTVELRSVGAAGARLLVQGENLPKGALSQIQLYPQRVVDGFSRAKTLLAKVLQILQGTAIGERELTYFVGHASQFGNLRLSALPTQASDDSVANATALFTQFRALADYADLRKGPAGGTDGLIDVFQAATQTAPPLPPATVFANLTRRSDDAAMVQELSNALGAEPHFADTTGVRRVWDALQIVQILGLPIASITGATAIVNAAPAAPEQIAANFKNAVKARYTIDQWRPIAKSVFDVLRKRKRDALVAYLLELLHLQSANQLFEYFLIDPGMEPVVQTSRLRLAMSSVQTFVQRCLLNLENGNTSAPAKNVSPSAIRADWWEWMKRYRVWEVNRKIFLFPENWMEPELRLDKTDLFQTLEGDLLQGDVTSDLVEDAFLAYLKGLDLRARLDIVATYLEQDLVNPGQSVLHVLGRTYGSPRKYFYRTYADGTWSGWEAVTGDIDGDHIVIAKWRGRVNVFWTTFVIKSIAPASSRSKGGGAVSGLDFGTLSDDIFKGAPLTMVHAQLHWMEYLQGKWSPRISSDPEKAEGIQVHGDFDVRSVHIHTSTELDAQKNEGAIRIHLDFPDEYEIEYKNALSFALATMASEKSIQRAGVMIDSQAIAVLTSVQRANHAFRVTSKNCNPDFSSVYWQPPQALPYNTTGIDATFYTGSSSLSASFVTAIKDSGDGTPEVESILTATKSYEVLACGNAVVPPFLDPSDLRLSEAGGLVAPIFFKDTSNRDANASGRDERTFFVEPSLTETVIEKWEGWAVQPPPTKWLTDPSIVDVIDLEPQVPIPVPIDPGDPIYSINKVKKNGDWVTDPATAIDYGGVLVDKSGGVTAVGARSTIAELPGSAVASGVGFTVVGRGGLGLNEMQTIGASIRGSLIAGVPTFRG